MRVGWENGRSQPIQFDVEEIKTALSDSYAARIYVVDESGLLSAYQMPESEDFTEIPSSTLEQLWQVEIDSSGDTQLRTLPDGGVILISNTKMVAYSTEGELLWQHELAGRPYDWLITPDGSYFSSVGSDQGVWYIQNGNPPQTVSHIGGHLAQSGEHIWIYSGNGLYRFNPGIVESDTELIFALPSKLLQWGDISPLQGGGVLLLHPDSSANRLITVSQQGEIQQQAAYPTAVGGNQQLLTSGEQIYLISEQNVQNSTNLVIFKLDLLSLQLQRIFSGGTRTSVPTDTWLISFEETKLLFNIGGGTLFTLDPLYANELMSQISE